MKHNRLKRSLSAVLVATLAGASSVVLLAQPAAAVGTVLLNETFTGSSVADARAFALNDACLTGASLGSTPPPGTSNLSDCQGHTNGTPPAGVTPGWLQLTDVAQGRTGGMVFDRALPARAGLVVEFDQAQYGGSGADGIGFFLTDGSRVLSTLGSTGGGLGYAQDTMSPGVDGGYLGVGLDSWGNFVNNGAGKGAGCAVPSPIPSATVRNTVALRGPGDGMFGYCYLTSTATAPGGPSTLPGQLRNATGPDAAVRNTRVTVSPDTYPTVTVEIDFDNGRDSYQTVAVYTMADAVPPTYKFGFAGATGGITDVHLIRNVTITTVDPLGDIELTKQIDRTNPQPSSYGYGETIPYQFVVTNTGIEAINNIVVSDPLVSNISCPVTTLGPAGGADSSMVCTGSHVVTGTESTQQYLTNNASVTADSPAAGTVTDTSSVTVSITESQPRLSLVKSALINDSNSNGVADLGETLSFSFLVSNTGNVPLTGVGVSDPKAGAVSCPVTALDVGETTTCTANNPYTVTESDLLGGGVTNTATGNASPPPGVPAIAPPTDTVTTPTVATGGGLSLTKSAALNDANANGTADAGETINYSFAVTNTGNVTLAGVGITDPLAGAVTCLATTLAPGASTTCAAVSAYTVTETDIIAGGVVNTATANGTTPPGVPPLVPPTDSVRVATTLPTASMSLAKSATLNDTNANGLADPGETISYSFLLTNLGNTTLTGVGVSDPKVGSVTCPTTTLTPGLSTTCTADNPYTVIESDVLAIGVVNTATGNATPPAGVSFTPPTDTVTTPTQPSSSGLTMRKTAALNDLNANDVADVGETIDYTFLLTNTGNTSLTGVSVSDPKAGSVTCPSTTLAPGASMTCNADSAYTVINADIVAGNVQNTATASATPPPGAPPITSPVEIVTVPTPLLSSGLSLRKDDTINDANGNGLADLGETIDYTFTLLNVGTISLTGITVDDPKVGPITCVSTSLAPGATTTCTSDNPYTVVEDDLIAGGVINVATADATPPPNVGFPPPTDTITTPTPAPQAGLSLVKSASLNDANGNSLADIGEEIDYSFLVTNIGNMTLTGVNVTDPTTGSTSCPVTTLAPGESTTCTADVPYITTEADIINRTIDNVATANGTPPAGVTPILPPTGTTQTQASAPFPAMSLVKSATLNDTNGNSLGDTGETIDYSFVLTNTGNLTLTDVGIDDPKAGATSCVVTTLAPADSTTCTANTPYSITEVDLVAGGAINIATGRGTPPPGSPALVPPIDQVNIPTTPPIAYLAMTKVASLNDTNGNGLADLGESVNYSFVVTNPGTVTNTNIAIQDAKVGPITCPVTTLAPGATTTCSAASYRVTEADILADNVVNTATVEGTPPGNLVLDPDDPTSTDTVTIPTGLPTPALTMLKSGKVIDANGNGYVDAGEQVEYSFNLANVGNVSLTNIVVDDPKVGPTSCPLTTLAPGATTTCSAPLYTATAADINAGSVLNVATLTADVPQAVPPLDPVISTLALPAPPLTYGGGLPLAETGTNALAAIVGSFVLVTLGIALRSRRASRKQYPLSY